MTKEPTTSREYWQMVQRLALKTAWEKSDVRTFTIALIVFLLIIGLSGLVMLLGGVSYQFFADNGISSAIPQLIQIIISVICLAYFYYRKLFSIPPKFYFEQQADKIKLQSEIDKLREEIKPKLQIYFNESSVQTDSSPEGIITFYRVYVRNIGQVESVENLTVRITGENIKHLLPFTPTDMRATNSEGRPENYLNANTEIPIEVIYVTEYNNQPPEQRYKIEFGFANGMLNQRPEVQKIQLKPPFEFEIEASGKNTPAVSKTFTFYKNHVTPRNLYGFGEKLIDQAIT